MLDAVHDTVIWTTRKIKAIREWLRRTGGIRTTAVSGAFLYGSQAGSRPYGPPASRALQRP